MLLPLKHLKGSLINFVVYNSHKSILVSNELQTLSTKTLQHYGVSLYEAFLQQMCQPYFGYKFLPLQSQRLLVTAQIEVSIKRSSPKI